MALSSLPIWRDEQHLFVHERAAGAYDTAPYFLATVACDLVPYRLLPPLILTWVLYGACGLNDGAGRQPLFAAVLVLTNLVSGAYAVRSVGDEADAPSASVSLLVAPPPLHRS